MVIWISRSFLIMLETIFNMISFYKRKRVFYAFCAILLTLSAIWNWIEKNKDILQSHDVTQKWVHEPGIFVVLEKYDYVIMLEKDGKLFNTFVCR